MSQHIPATTVAGVLRDVAHGRRSIRVAPGKRTWLEEYAGNVHFEIDGDWKIVIFNDCDELDYVDSATRGGKSADFGRWNRIDGKNPLEFLEADDCDALERVLEEACHGSES